MDCEIDYSNLALPVRFTKSLTGDENFTSQIDVMLPVINAALGSKDHGLYNFQKWLLRHIFETYPPGHPKAGLLRFRQVLILMGRQNGKTEIGAGAGIHGLRRNPRDQLIGVASNAQQANVLYRRTMGGIDNLPALKKRFQKLTSTRGIRSIDGSRYEIRPAKADSMQGEPIEMGLIDEVHIVPEDLHQAMLAGLGGRDNAILVMISTAGDETSTLLEGLQHVGEQSLQLDPAENRFGYFVYEAPEARIPEDKETLIEYLMAANPKYAERQSDIENLIEDLKTMRPEHIIRYHLNRSVTSTAVFVQLEEWMQLKRPQGQQFPKDQPIIFAVERTREWSHATITANTKDADGKIHTEIVASIVNPDEEKIFKTILELRKHRPIAFAFDSLRFKNLKKWCKQKNILNVYAYSSSEIAQACSVFYAKVKQKRISHANDPLIIEQLPGCLAKTRGQNFVVERVPGASEIDSVYCTIIGVYAADTIRKKKLQIY